MNMRSGIVLCSCLLFVVGACKSKDKKREANIGNLYFDYQVNAREGDDNLTVLLQYRDGDEEGDALAVPAPASIMLDGEVVALDSTKTTGYFYELHKPIASFGGKHTIEFKSGDKVYNEEFIFSPLVLQTTMTDTLQRSDQVFKFDGLEPEDYVRVLINDTSVTNDINRIDTVRNGQLILSARDWELLAPGPVQIEFVREYEREIKNAPSPGGRLFISYGLKREFVLAER